MFLKIVFLFIVHAFFFGVQGQAGPHSQLMKCSHDSPEAYEYRFSSKNLHIKIKELKSKIKRQINERIRMMDIHNDLITDPMTNIDEAATYEKEQERLWHNHTRQQENEHCPLTRTEANSLHEIILKECRSKEIEDLKIKCKAIKHIILEKTCGVKNTQTGDDPNYIGCSSGQHIKAEKLVKQLTPKIENNTVTLKEMRRFTITRNEMAKDITIFKDGFSNAHVDRDGYKHCLEGMKTFVSRRTGNHPCFDAYNRFFDSQMDNIVTNCFTIDPYMKEVRNKIEEIQQGIAEVYTNIKNDYTMARLCTMKLTQALKNMDHLLDSFSSSQKQRMAASRDGNG